MRCAPRATNGPNHLGLCALQGLPRPEHMLLGCGLQLLLLLESPLPRPPATRHSATRHTAPLLCDRTSRLLPRHGGCELGSLRWRGRLGLGHARRQCVAGTAHPSKQCVRCVRRALHLQAPPLGRPACLPPGRLGAPAAAVPFGWAFSAVELRVSEHAHRVMLGCA